MAHHRSALKKIRQDQKRAAANQSRKQRVRTFVKKCEVALAGEDKSLSLEAFRVAQSELMRGVTKGILHKNTASRKISRLAARLVG